MSFSPLRRLPYFSPSRPRAFAHRGLSRDAPENTLLAFARAVDVGATFLETDVHSSADGIAIISHDPDLRRVAGRSAAVGDLTAAQLARIELGQGQGFASLADALDSFPDTRFNIDIKAADAVGPTVAAVRAVGAEDRVLLTSFSERNRAAALRVLPEVATSASSSRFAVALLANRLRLTPLVRRALRGIDAVQVPSTYGRVRIVTAALVSDLHNLGVEVHVWTVNDPTEMLLLMQLGVDGVVSDRVDVALDVIDEFRSDRSAGDPALTASPPGSEPPSFWQESGNGGSW